MNLTKALRVDSSSRLALVGAGGKTTALFQIARQLKPPVVVTATTHLGEWQIALADRHEVITEASRISMDETQVPPAVILYTGIVEQGRAAGLDDASLNRLFQLAEMRKLPLLIEADGSRQLAVKAPAEHEPVIPSFVQEVVVCAGMSAVGRELSADWVHRAERFAELSGLPLGATITGEAIARVLSHPLGGLKGIPSAVRRVALLNQADAPQLQAQAHTLARDLIVAYQAVVIASLVIENNQLPREIMPPETSRRPVEQFNTSRVYAVHERIAGIVLAAGESTRFGKPKQLLTWKGESFISHVVHMAGQAGLSPIVVVTGSSGKEVERSLEGMGAQVVYNPEWQAGQSSSIQMGLSSLPGEIGGVVFLLADQPQIPAGLVRTLVEEHATTLSPIVAPMIDGQRGNPVLFDRMTFKDLMTIEGDVGGRKIFSRYPMSWIQWHDPQVLFDIDTPQDYKDFLETMQ